uniref:Glycoprotein n=1 Tax=Hymenopteran orino-related virus OKIAV88 TaxID=2746372 RepID=A0A7D7JZF4_9MONO|nr:glycoprotein [Hymenopteran orino-related virus OKIAV88]
MGSYSKDEWTEQVALTQEEAYLIRTGRCPSQTHPTPLLKAPDYTCEWSWPKQTATELIYCITRPTTVREIPSQYIQSDEEHLTACTWSQDFCRTISGAYVTWNNDNADRHPSMLTRYTGPAQKIEDTWILSNIQEAYTTVRIETENRTHITHVTEEGFSLVVDKTTYRMKSKRAIDNSLALLQEAIHNEVNAKLQYNSIAMDTYVNQLMSACKYQATMATALDKMTMVSSDPYVRALLQTDLITSSVTSDYILVWPCIPIPEWNVRLENTTSLCTSYLPINYLMETWRTGYMDPSTQEVKNATDLIDCHRIQPQAIQVNDSVLIWNGKVLMPIPTVNISAIPIIMENRTHYAPIWRNNWLYTREDFTFDRAEYLTHEDWRAQDAHHLSDEEYHMWLRAPFVGMPTIPSLGRVWELASAVGGFLYLWSLVSHWISRFNNATPVIASAPHEELTPMTRYQLAKSLH